MFKVREWWVSNELEEGKKKKELLYKNNKMQCDIEWMLNYTRHVMHMENDSWMIAAHLLSQWELNREKGRKLMNKNVE